MTDWGRQGLEPNENRLKYSFVGIVCSIVIF